MRSKDSAEDATATSNPTATPTPTATSTSTPNPTSGARPLALARELGSTQAALSVVAFRCAEEAGFLPRGLCAKLAQGTISELRAHVRELRARTASALPPWPILERADPAQRRRRLGDCAAAVLAGPALEPEDLCAAAEELAAERLGARDRRSAGLYYTPRDVAARVVELGLRHGSVGSQLPRVLDPCAGAGAFLAAAARALSARHGRLAAASACSGADVDAGALRVARAALALAAGPSAGLDHLAALKLRAVDSLRHAPRRPADLVVSNPPYGHVGDAATRAFLARRLPGLRGGEIDRYAAFLLRSLELVRAGGTVALLVPDTWMTNARSGALRSAMLDAAELACAADLGKPFAAAKDTRVQAIVLVRRAGRRRPRVTVVARGSLALAPVDEAELRARAASGWQIYRSPAERRLCAAMESASVPLGEICEVGYGLRTGDNARHVLRAPAQPGDVGLVGGEDIVPFSLRLLPKRLADPTPALLRLAQKQRGRARVAIQRIRTNSTAPHARWLEAALVGPELVCLDSLSTLACGDEELRWALLGLVCSVALNRYHRLRTTDVNVKPSALRELPAPCALLAPGRAGQLAALVRARVEEAGGNPTANPNPKPTATPNTTPNTNPTTTATPTTNPTTTPTPNSDPTANPTATATTTPTTRVAALAPALERAIDREIYDLYGLGEAEREEAERGFWGPRFAVEFPRLREACRTLLVTWS